MLTIWNWRDEKTMLRSKAFSQDVFRVTFSADLIGHLTSSGTGHIRCVLHFFFGSPPSKVSPQHLDLHSVRLVHTYVKRCVLVLESPGALRKFKV